MELSSSEDDRSDEDYNSDCDEDHIVQLIRKKTELVVHFIINL